ncbi:MAG TPA: hypothetical protein VE992_01560 [Solirubrobacteraceae bacterium]|nr:hypothetical protein [Solirubrobacteraceae bacterium]
MSGDSQAGIARLARAPARSGWPQWRARLMTKRRRDKAERLVVLERLERERRLARRTDGRPRQGWPHS